jgi:hypothetical protein
MGKAKAVDADGLEGAVLDAAVAAVAGAVQHGDVVPGKGGAARQQGGLVSLDGEEREAAVCCQAAVVASTPGWP